MKVFGASPVGLVCMYSTHRSFYCTTRVDPRCRQRVPRHAQRKNGGLTRDRRVLDRRGRHTRSRALGAARGTVPQPTHPPASRVRPSLIAPYHANRPGGSGRGHRPRRALRLPVLPCPRAVTSPALLLASPGRPDIGAANGRPRFGGRGRVTAKTGGVRGGAPSRLGNQGPSRSIAAAAAAHPTAPCRADRARARVHPSPPPAPPLPRPSSAASPLESV